MSQLKKYLFNLNFWVIFFGFIFLFSIFFYQVRDLTSVQLHIDEHERVRRGAILFEAAFIRADFQDPLWQDFISLDNPNLGHFLYGFWTYLYSQQNPVQLMNRLQFNEPYDGHYSERYPDLWNQRNWWIKYAEHPQPAQLIPNEHQASFQLIVINRYLSVMFLLGTALVIIGIIKQVADLETGLMTACLYLLLPLHQPHSYQTMLGPIFTFFLTLTLFLLLRITNQTKSRPWLLVGTGIAAGLTAAIRLDGFMTLILICFILSFEFFQPLISQQLSLHWTQLKKWMLKLLTTISSACTIFYLFNPYVWQQPLDKVGQMLTFRHRYANKRLADDLLPQLALPRFSQRLNQILTELVTPFSPDGLTVFSLIQVVTFGFGLYYLFHSQPQSIIFKKKYRLGFYLLGIALIMSSYLTVDLPRYYLPLLPGAAIMQALGLKQILQLIKTNYFDHQTE